MNYVIDIERQFIISVSFINEIELKLTEIIQLR